MYGWMDRGTETYGKHVRMWWALGHQSPLSIKQLHRSLCFGNQPDSFVLGQWSLISVGPLSPPASLPPASPMESPLLLIHYEWWAFVFRQLKGFVELALCANFIRELSCRAFSKAFSWYNHVCCNYCQLLRLFVMIDLSWVNPSSLSGGQLMKGCLQLNHSSWPSI